MNELSHKEVYRLIHQRQLTSNDRAALRAHLSQCEPCRRLTALDGLLSRYLVLIPESQRPSSAQTAVYMARVKRQNRSQKIMKPVYALAGSAVIIILALAGWYLMRPDPEVISLEQTPIPAAVLPTSETQIKPAIGASGASAEELFAAIEAKDASGVEQLLEAGASPDAIDAEGESILAAAIRAAGTDGSTEIVSLLLENGADVNVLDSSGNALLPKAARDGQLEVVQLLLDAGADVDGPINDTYGADDTGLARAAIYNHLEIAELLIAHGADVNHAESRMGYTVLIDAAYFNNPEIITILLDNGADPDQQCCPNSGGGALHGAAEQGGVEAAQALLDGGADADIETDLGVTPLMSAISKGSSITLTEMVTVLLDGGADPNKQDINGNSALHHAAKLGKKNAIPILLEYGASLALQNNDGETAVDAATNDEIIELLREVAEATVIKDVLYVTAFDPAASDQLLDIYHLPGSEEQKPVVILAHGFTGNKSGALALGQILAKEGFVVLSIDWEDNAIADDTTGYKREAIEDAECALRFAAEHGAAYGADPDNVIWWGYSAGAWLGSMISFAEGDLQGEWNAYAADNDGPAQRVACVASGEPAQITGFVGSAGLYLPDFWLGDPTINEQSASYAPLQANSAIGNNPDLKVRIIHGEYDTSWDTDFEVAQRFAEALQQAGYDAEFLPQFGGHTQFSLVAIEQIQALAD